MVSYQLAGLSPGCEEGEALKVLMGSGSTLAGNPHRRWLPFPLAPDLILTKGAGGSRPCLCADLGEVS